MRQAISPLFAMRIFERLVRGIPSVKKNTVIYVESPIKITEQDNPALNNQVTNQPIYQSNNQSIEWTQSYCISIQSINRLIGRPNRKVAHCYTLYTSIFPAWCRLQSLLPWTDCCKIWSKPRRNKDPRRKEQITWLSCIKTLFNQPEQQSLYLATKCIRFDRCLNNPREAIFSERFFSSRISCN